MTDQTRTPALLSPDCSTFEQHLADYLEGALDESMRSMMNTHRRTCGQCNSLVRDLEDLTNEARALPVLTPSRDLWAGIESRLDTVVIPLPQRSLAADAPPTRRTITVRTFAMAAALLVAVTSGVTWRLARVQPARGRSPVVLATQDAPAVPSANAMRPESLPAPVSIDAPVPARLAAASLADVDDIYEREISSLRVLVDERFAELDPATVKLLRANIAIIDAAIADSRRALAADPRSRLLSTQLDRALETKLALMRRVALL